MGEGKYATHKWYGKVTNNQSDCDWLILRCSCRRGFADPRSGFAEPEKHETPPQLYTTSVFMASIASKKRTRTGDIKVGRPRIKGLAEVAAEGHQKPRSEPPHRRCSAVRVISLHPPNLIKLMWQHNRCAALLWYSSEKRDT